MYTNVVSQRETASYNSLTMGWTLPRTYILRRAITMADLRDDLTVRFLCGLRGYHVYRSVWTPKQQEVLDARQESNNPYDPYAIAAWNRASAPDPNKVVGHLPNEISRFTWFIIAHGAVVTVRVISPKYRRSPLIRGGLEIPIEVCASMANSDENKQALAKYTELVNDHYEEPTGENFRDYTSSILARIGVDDDSDFSSDESDVNEQ